MRTLRLEIIVQTDAEACDPTAITDNSVVVPCGRSTCPECAFRAFVATLSQQHTIAAAASWHEPGNAGTFCDAVTVDAEGSATANRRVTFDTVTASSDMLEEGLTTLTIVTPGTPA